MLQASFSGGSATVNNLPYSEVGSFTIRGAASNYLNSGINFQTDNGVVGRFTPAYFDVDQDRRLSRRRHLHLFRSAVGRWYGHRQGGPNRHD